VKVYFRLLRYWREYGSAMEGGWQVVSIINIFDMELTRGEEYLEII
jgi:hypothetical protein